MLLNQAYRQVELFTGLPAPGKRWPRSWPDADRAPLAPSEPESHRASPALSTVPGYPQTGIAEPD